MRYEAPMLQPMYESPIILDLEDFVSGAADAEILMCSTGGIGCVTIPLGPP